MGATREDPFINKNLITLKCVVFFVISGITALHVLHAITPMLLGLTFEEYRTISIIAPFVSILGPLIAGPLADRLAAKNANNFGRILRYLTALFLILSAIVYALLLTVPVVERGKTRQPRANFGCNLNGGIIFQERCQNETTCHNWENKIGKLKLSNCTYTCRGPGMEYDNMYTPWLEHIPTPSPSTEHSSELDYDDESIAAVTESMRTKRGAGAVRSIADPVVKSIEASSESAGGEQISAEDHHAAGVRKTRAILSNPRKIYVEPPHLCVTEKNENGEEIVKNCHVYTNDTKYIEVEATLQSAADIERDTLGTEWCSYPLNGFRCQIPEQQVIEMKIRHNTTECKPIMKCLIIDPYTSTDSVLADSECVEIIGDLDATLGGYTAIRLLGDIFPMAALTLLNTAIVIAVRETSEGRGEVCRQYAWGAIGYVLVFGAELSHDNAVVAGILVIVFFLIGAVILLFASNMPLSPPEWWWHTKTGMLVYPMSAIRRYSPEIFVLTLVSILFGTFWSSIHSFLRWTFTPEHYFTYSGLILVLVLLFNVDKFIEYCGHSNIFIAGFAIFIIRFAALSGEEENWLTILMETIEPVVIGILWITIILYMRHAMPRKLTATGQAIAVLAFFGIGKGCGALIGLARDERNPKLDSQAINQWLAIAACIIACVYFVIYNLILAPRCAAKPQHVEDLISGSASQNFAGTNGGGGGGGTGTGTGTGSNAGAALNGNGNYSPLRVYHNERGKKGQFRY